MKILKQDVAPLVAGEVASTTLEAMHYHIFVGANSLDRRNSLHF